MPLPLYRKLKLRKHAGIKHNNIETFKTDLEVNMIKKYNQFRSQNKEQHQEVESWLILEAIDKGWKQHMLNIDNLKEGISLRIWGQKNPLVEYKRESFAMFQEMLNFIKWEIVYHIFHLNAERFNRAELIKKREAELEQININLPEDKVGKNLKLKICCLSWTSIH